ncbi:protein of unknown function (DUF5595) [Nakaseomyces glabratus]|nr:protein of unknown function (DUF5595) [Nakaseomyces glabratus]KAH7596619.1 protein of unknown function (DUF5595) [Nakaseomyces glabratus]
MPNEQSEASVLSRLNPHRFTTQIPQHPLSQNMQRRRNSVSSAASNSINSLKQSSARAVSNSNGIQKNNKKYMRSTVAGASGILPTYNKSMSFSQNKNLDDNNMRASLPVLERDLNANNFKSANNNPIGFSSFSQPYSGSRDPRPLRDKNFQSAIQQEIFDYLIQNTFEIDTNYPISLKTLKQPTQKSFVTIFKWLYLRLDPGYTFTKSIEYEVYQLLKILQYPYLESINKSQISAVGGSGWPKFLGMLHWLVTINLRLDKCLNTLDQNLLNQQTQDLTTLSKPVENIEDQEVRQEKYELMAERLFIDYITDSYKTFLNLKDDYSDHMNELKAGFERYLHIIKLDVNNIQSKNENMFEKFEISRNRVEKLKVARGKSTALNGDLVKFQKYVDSMKAKSEEWPIKLSKIEDELNEKKENIKLITEEISQIQDSLQRKGLSVEQIENKNEQKLQLEKEIDQIAEKADEFVSLIKSTKVDNEKVFVTFQDSIRQYNDLLLEFLTSRRKLGHDIEIEPLKITLPNEVVVPNSENALTMDKLFPTDHPMPEYYQNMLLSINSDIMKRIETLKTDNQELEREIGMLTEEINSRGSTNESLELKLSDLNLNLKNVRQENRAEILAQSLEIEKLERQITEGNKNIEQKIANAERIVTELLNEKEVLYNEHSKFKSDLNLKIQKLIKEAHSLRFAVKDSTNRLNELIFTESSETDD